MFTYIAVCEWLENYGQWLLLGRWSRFQTSNYLVNELDHVIQRWKTTFTKERRTTKCSSYQVLFVHCPIFSQLLPNGLVVLPPCVTLAQVLLVTIMFSWPQLRHVNDRFVYPSDHKSIAPMKFSAYSRSLHVSSEIRYGCHTQRLQRHDASSHGWHGNEFSVVPEVVDRDRHPGSRNRRPPLSKKPRCMSPPLTGLRWHDIYRLLQQFRRL